MLLKGIVPCIQHQDRTGELDARPRPPVYQASERVSGSADKISAARP